MENKSDSSTIQFYRDSDGVHSQLSVAPRPAVRLSSHRTHDNENNDSDDVKPSNPVLLFSSRDVNSYSNSQGFKSKRNSPSSSVCPPSVMQTTADQEATMNGWEEEEEKTVRQFKENIRQNYQLEKKREKEEEEEEEANNSRFPSPEPRPAVRFDRDADDDDDDDETQSKPRNESKGKGRAALSSTAPSSTTTPPPRRAFVLPSAVETATGEESFLQQRSLPATVSEVIAVLPEETDGGRGKSPAPEAQLLRQPLRPGVVVEEGEKGSSAYGSPLMADSSIVSPMPRPVHMLQAEEEEERSRRAEAPRRPAMEEAPLTDTTLPPASDPVTVHPVEITVEKTVTETTVHTDQEEEKKSMTISTYSFSMCSLPPTTTVAEAHKEGEEATPDKRPVGSTVLVEGDTPSFFLSHRKEDPTDEAEPPTSVEVKNPTTEKEISKELSLNVSDSTPREEVEAVETLPPVSAVSASPAPKPREVEAVALPGEENNTNNTATEEKEKEHSLSPPVVVSEKEKETVLVTPTKDSTKNRTDVELWNTPPSRVSEEVAKLVSLANEEIEKTRNSILASLSRQHRQYKSSHGTPAAAAEEAEREVVPSARTLHFTNHVHPDAEDKTPDTVQVAPTPQWSPVIQYYLSRYPCDVENSGTGTPQRNAVLRSVSQNTALLHALRQDLSFLSGRIGRRLMSYDPSDDKILSVDTVMAICEVVLLQYIQEKEEKENTTTAVTDGNLSAALADCTTPNPHDSTLTSSSSSVLPNIYSSARKRQRLYESATHGQDDSVKRRKAEDDLARPYTTVSPTRTLERLSSQKEMRQEEERLLDLLLFLFIPFQQVFGERYAWQHFGATQATRQDFPLGGKDASKREKKSGEGEIPAECVFPRLRQYYKCYTPLSHPSSLPSGEEANFLFPPPLDMLVKYEVFVNSLKELNPLS